MFVRLRVLVVASILLLVLGAWVEAQVFQRQPVNPPIVLSGNDIGFRMTAREGSTPVGSFVVRVDGQWVPVKSAPGVQQLTSR